MKDYACVKRAYINKKKQNPKLMEFNPDIHFLRNNKRRVQSILTSTHSSCFVCNYNLKISLYSQMSQVLHFCNIFTNFIILLFKLVQQCTLCYWLNMCIVYLVGNISGIYVFDNFDKICFSMSAKNMVPKKALYASCQ